MSSPRPAAAPARAGDDLDLDDRIVLAEMAVMARQDRIRRHAGSLVHRVQGGAFRYAGVGAAAAGGALLLMWLLGRRPAPAGAAAEAERKEELARDAGLSLAGLVPLVWPFMPRKLRASVTPGMAGAVLAFLAPLLGRLFGRTARRSGPRR